MEESLKKLSERIAGHCGSPSELSALTLAFAGDSVFDLIVRTDQICRADRSVNRLHKDSSRIVNASAQSRMVDIIRPMFTEKEEKIYRRGRNAKSNTVAKNSSVTEYRRATGFEAVLGFLFLSGEIGRLLELTDAALRGLEDENE